jgi:xylem cysteine proteinase
MKPVIVAVLMIGGLVLAGCGIFFAQGSSSADQGVPAEIHNAFTTWLQTNRRNYVTPQEHKYRLKVFHQNFLKVQEANRSQQKWRAGLNKFSDLTPEEFKSMYLNSKEPENFEVPEERIWKGGRENRELAPYINWVLAGKVNAVQDQGRCGSCWAHAALTAVEGAWAISRNVLEKFSEQQLVDCDEENRACGGGWHYYAYKHILKAGGIQRRSDYPYIAKPNGECRMDPKKFVGKLEDYYMVPRNACHEVLVALNVSPLAASVDAGPMQNYESGVWSVDWCSDQTNHAISIVGYGDEWKTGQDFWLVRNTFGTDWGEKGYIRMDRNVQRTTGLCGICTVANFPFAADP